MTISVASPPASATLPGLRKAALGCRSCDLWERATQTVFGEGPPDAKVMLIGEQPGDREDESGRPFVGPAGRVLDEALAEIGLSREEIFVTNVVKHFKWRPVAGSKRRLHERPSRAEVAACRPWVEAELEVIRPEFVGILGATAAQALIAPDFSVTREHGVIDGATLATVVVATIHPSAILRARGAANRAALHAGLVGDLRALVPPE
jgi:uracil-DNA glycosylase